MCFLEKTQKYIFRIDYLGMNLLLNYHGFFSRNLDLLWHGILYKEKLYIMEFEKLVKELSRVVHEFFGSEKIDEQNHVELFMS